MRDQPVPQVSSADVLRVIQRDFGNEMAQEAMVILESLAAEPNQLSPRVQLAVLKLADGNLSDLRYYADEAQKDFRDVLAWAEYPAYLAEDPKLGDAKAEIIERDWRQYQSWLYG